MLIIKNSAGGGTNLMTTNHKPNSGANQDVDLADLMNNDSWPIGSIMPYNGSLGNIPDTWKICDGSNGTPNLVDRFVMGASNPAEAGRSMIGGTVHSTVKNHTHNISVTSSGGHKHTVKAATHTSGADGKHDHTQKHAPEWGSGRGVCNACGHRATGNPRLKYKDRNINTTGNPGNHTHTFNIGNTGTSSAGAHNHSNITVSHGASGTGKNLPKYVKMYFIMKVR